MTVRVLQRGFNFSQDGPGNRLVVHLQGCNMHCPWCSNPESMASEGVVMAASPAADALCPKGAVRNGVPDQAVCKTCEKPCLTLPGRELRFSCESVPAEELLREIRSAVPLFFDGGGVTFTGGEATVQFDALSFLLHTLHDEGVHTALETNGSHPRLAQLLCDVDFLIFDVKHWDDETHRRVIGCSNCQTVQNLHIAAETRAQLAVRIPLIGGFNDTPDDAKAFAGLLSVLKPAHTLEVLRYHEYGRDKWKQCGMTYTMHDAFVSDETYETFCGVLRDGGLTLVRT